MGMGTILGLEFISKTEIKMIRKALTPPAVIKNIFFQKFSKVLPFPIDNTFLFCYYICTRCQSCSKVSHSSIEKNTVIRSITVSDSRKANRVSDFPKGKKSLSELQKC